MKAMILAAGLGTRLGGLTRELPKPLLPIEGKPLLEYTLRYLRHHGFTDILINLHFLGAMIEERFGDGSGMGLHLAYSHEPALLGTAGGVRTAWRTDDEFILVVYGDLLLNQDIAPLVARHRAANADATLLVHQRAKSNSILELDADMRLTGFIERPAPEVQARYDRVWVNSGMQILRRGLLDDLPEGQFADLPKDVYVPHCTDRRFYAVELTGQRVAIDSPERYEQACRLAREASFPWMAE